jgi:Nucleotidyl transferase AbiEii toxin, Type IV TA system
VAPGRRVLKGGFALDLRLGAKARATKDVDLARCDNVEQATADLLAAQAEDLGDYFVFAVERTDDLDDAFEGAAVRYRVTASLAGRRFEQVVVDVGFGDPLPLEPDVLPGPDLLGFAGVEPAHFPAIPLEQHVAEKVHAYTRVYGLTGHHSTRVKDLVDLVLVSTYERLGGSYLRRALRSTYDTRGTHPLPEALPAPPASWRAPYRKLATSVGITADLTNGYARAAALVNPVLAATVTDDERWDPVTGAWQSDGA